jgi:hypothetical protein
MDPATLALSIPIIALCIPITAILTSHRQKLAEIKARTAGGLAPEIRAELSEIKNQLADLRDTTTRFDMTFDAALDRLEQRVGRVEERQIGAGNASNRAADEPLLAGRRSAGA